MKKIAPILFIYFCLYSPQIKAQVDIEYPLNVNAGSSQVITPGASVMIGSLPSIWGGAFPYTFQWTPSIGLSNPALQNPLATPFVTTTYTLTVTDANSVTKSSTCTITVQPMSNPSTVVWTNIRNVTSNGDNSLSYPGNPPAELQVYDASTSPPILLVWTSEKGYGVASSVNALMAEDTGRFTFTVGTITSGHRLYGFSLSNNLCVDVPYLAYPDGYLPPCTDCYPPTDPVPNQQFPTLVCYFDIYGTTADIYLFENRIGQITDISSTDQFSILKYFVSPTDQNAGMYNGDPTSSIVFLRNGTYTGYSMPWCDRCDGSMAFGANVNVSVAFAPVGTNQPPIQILPIQCTFSNTPNQFVAQPYNYNAIWDPILAIHTVTPSLVAASLQPANSNIVATGGLSVETDYPDGYQDQGFIENNGMAEAVSTNLLSDTSSGYIELQLTSMDAYAGGFSAFGLASYSSRNQYGQPSNNFNNIMCFMLDEDYDLLVYDNGTLVASLGSIVLGDVLYIYRYKGQFGWFKNGECLFVTNNYQYYLPDPNSPGNYNYFDPNEGTIDKSNFSMRAIYGCTGFKGGLYNLTASFPPQSPLMANAGGQKGMVAGSSITIGDSPSAIGGVPGNFPNGGLPYWYSWSPSTGLDNRYAANPLANPSITTTYTLSVFDDYNHNATSTSTVNVVQTPLLSLDSLKYCPGLEQSFNLSVTNVQAGVLYRWYLNDSPIAGATSGTYTENSPPLTTSYYKAEAYINIQSAQAGLASSFSVSSGNTKIMVNPLVNIPQAVGPPCYNNGNGSIQVSVQGGSGNFVYSLDGGSQVDSPNFTNVTIGTHTITIIDDQGCTIADQIEVPPVSIGQ